VLCVFSLSFFLSCLCFHVFLLCAVLVRAITPSCFMSSCLLGLRFHVILLCVRWPSYLHAFLLSCLHASCHPFTLSYFLTFVLFLLSSLLLRAFPFPGPRGAAPRNLCSQPLCLFDQGLPLHGAKHSPQSFESGWPFGLDLVPLHFACFSIFCCISNDAWMNLVKNGNHTFSLDLVGFIFLMGLKVHETSWLH